MKLIFLRLLILVSFFFMSCAVKKGVITIDDLSAEKILIIGVIEYDYSQLEKISSTDLELSVKSKKEVSDFKLPEKYLPDEQFKKYNFISIIGDTGVYELCLAQHRISTSETDDFLNLMDIDRDLTSTKENTLKKLSLYRGKIINLGKIIVKLKSDNVKESNTSYTYTVRSVDSDTVAIYAFKETYPLIYHRYQNDVYVIRNKINECLEYILTNISEAKSQLLLSFIKDHPDQIDFIFKDLTPETQERVAKDIEKYTIDELDDFLKKVVQ